MKKKRHVTSRYKIENAKTTITSKPIEDGKQSTEEKKYRRLHNANTVQQ